MQKFIYKFAILIAMITLITAFLNGVSLPTSLIRAGLIFIGTLLLFFMALALMRWTVITTTIIDQNNEQKNREKGSKEEGEEVREKTSILPREKPIEVNS